MAKYLRNMTGDPRPALSYDFVDVFGPEAYDAILSIRPWTFGMALRRARRWEMSHA